jgi:hypothetical protein
VNGEPGAPAPLIGVKEDPDSGIYYWTLDNEWIYKPGTTDEKIPVTGNTPQLRINNNFWEVCINGACAADDDWDVLLSNGNPVSAVGPQGDAIFAKDGITEYDDYVEFLLADGATTIQVPKYRPLSVTFDQPVPFTTHEEPIVIACTYTGQVKSITVVDVPHGWTVTPNIADSLITVVSPADNGKYYTAAGTATLIISDDTEHTITRTLVLECPTYTPPAGLEIIIATLPQDFQNGEPQNIPFTTKSAVSVMVTDVPHGWSVTVALDPVAGVGAGTFIITAPSNGLVSGTALALASDSEGKSAGCMLPLKLVPVDGGDTGDCRWTITGISGSYTLTISPTDAGGAMEDYDGKNAQAPWISSYGDDIKNLYIQEDVTTIGNYAFSSCRGLTSVVIPNSVTAIGENAFSYCGNLTSVTISKSIDVISKRAFFNCGSLTSVVIVVT